MVIVYLFIVIACCFAIWAVSDVFESSTEYLGRNMSNGVRGASLNAIGSSMPELVTSFIFLFYISGSEGYAGTIGTTAGSAVFNTLLIPAAVILVVFGYGIINHTKGIELNSKVIKRDGIFLLVSELALIIFISTNTITLFDALCLIFIYIIYSIVLFKQGGEKLKKIKGTPIENRKAWVQLIFSVILMTVICWILVDSVEKIGILMEIPLIFVSIILASAASSVPDTIISIKDGLKGNYDDAVSNALGSNIFDICIAHGLPLAIYIGIYGPITMAEDTNQYSVELRIALIIVTLLATVIYFIKKNFFERQGYQLIIIYIIFITYAILRGLGII